MYVSDVCVRTVQRDRCLFGCPSPFFFHSILSHCPLAMSDEWALAWPRQGQRSDVLVFPLVFLPALSDRSNERSPWSLCLPGIFLRPTSLSLWPHTSRPVPLDLPPRGSGAHSLPCLGLIQDLELPRSLKRTWRLTGRVSRKGRGRKKK